MTYGIGHVNMDGEIIPHYRVGDVIEYATFGGMLRVVRVQTKERDIKNGRPGFDGVVLHHVEEAIAQLGQNLVWGYDDQITRIIARGDDAA